MLRRNDVGKNCETLFVCVCVRVCVCAGDLAVIVEALKDALFSLEGKKRKKKNCFGFTECVLCDEPG